jgi:membrane protein
MRPRQMFGLLKQAVSSWSADYAPSMGAALSYYTLFSIAPLLLIVISVAGLIFGDDAVRGEVFGQLQGILGADGAKAVEDMLQSVSKTGEGIVATVTGVAVLLLGATTVFGELQNALDRIWRAPAREQSSGWWSLLRTRLLSFGMVLGIAFLLMVSLVLSAAVSALGKWFGGGAEALVHTLELALSFGLMTVLFALIYKFIPRVHIAWHDVWIGAAVTALLLSVGKFLIGLYLGKSAVASSFGAAGSLVVLMVWVYYAAQIFLLGAEFTWVYAHELGSRRGQPRPGAEERKPSAEQQPVVQPALPANAPLWSAAPPRKRSPIPALAAFAVGAVLGFFTQERKVTRE